MSKSRDLGEFPAAALDIDASGNISVTGDVSLADNDKLILGTGSDLQIYHSGSTAVINNDVGHILIENTSDDKDIYIKSDDGAGGSATYIQVDGGAGSVNLRHYGLPKLATTATGIDVTGTVTADGLTVAAGAYGTLLTAGGTNGYISVSNPSENLVTAFTGTSDVLALGTSNTERMRIDSSGNLLVGKTAIGTAEGVQIEPAGAISLVRGGSTTLYLNRLTSDGNLIDFRKDGTTLGSISARSGNFAIESGDVGLHFNSAIESVYPTNGAGSLKSGAINLGYNSSRFKDLYLSGEAIVGGMYTNTLGTSNFRAGVDAGSSIVAGGNYNTIVGDAAGRSITSGDKNVAVGFASQLNTTTASSNTTLGFYSGYAITTGTLNTAIGTESGASITTGQQNTLIGANAGDSLTTADFNVAVGTNALGADTLGNHSIAIGRGALELQNFTTATDAYNTAVGSRAGRAITTGTSNTLIGGLAGDAITTGTNNTAVGAESLSDSTTGGYNTAVGAYANQRNTTGSSNSSLGRAALNSNTTGNSNTAIGRSALYANITASDNTAVGNDALKANTTGLQNTAVGAGSLDANTTASQNTAVGAFSLGSATTGGGNVAFGRAAAFGLTTGLTNTALGNSALSDNSTGNTNTAVGGSSGGSITTGSGNTTLGERSGNYSTSLTTGSNNTLVGSLTYIGTANSVGAVVLGHAVQGYSGYTTLGYSTADIRTANGSIAWATVSDQRYKKNIQDCTAGLNFVNSLRSRTWDYKTLGELPETFSAYKADSTEVFKNTRTNHGFIAQEVKAAIDADSGIADGFKLWDEREDGSQEVAEAALIPVLVKAIQQLSAQVDALTARIETLEG